MSRSPRRIFRCEAVVVDALGGAGSVSRIAVSRARPESRRIVNGRLPRQELVEHDAERIDVGRRAQRLAGDLLRRRVLGCVRTPGQVGQPRLTVVPGVEQLGDAEVQQPDLAVVRDEDIGRLEVAVDDQPAVRVRDGLHDLEEQAHASTHVQPFLLAVRADGPAGDVFQRQIGPAFRRHARIVEPRDVRVFERGQDVALTSHARDEVGPPGAIRQLQGDLALQQAVGALGQPDGAHAACADGPEQPVGADDRAGGLDVRHRVEQLSVGVVGAGGGWPAQWGKRFEEGRGLNGRSEAEKRAGSRLEPFLVRAEPGEPALDIVGRKVKRLVEQPVELRPRFSVHDVLAAPILAQRLAQKQQGLRSARRGGRSSPHHI